MLALAERARRAAALRNGHPHQNWTGTVRAAADQRAALSWGQAVERMSTARARGQATTSRRHQAACSARASASKVSGSGMVLRSGAGLGTAVGVAVGVGVAAVAAVAASGPVRSVAGSAGRLGEPWRAWSGAAPGASTTVARRVARLTEAVTTSGSRSRCARPGRRRNRTTSRRPRTPGGRAGDRSSSPRPSCTVRMAFPRLPGYRPQLWASWSPCDLGTGRECGRRTWMAGCRAGARRAGGVRPLSVGVAESRSGWRWFWSDGRMRPRVATSATTTVATDQHHLDDGGRGQQPDDRRGEAGRAAGARSIPRSRWTM